MKAWYKSRTLWFNFLLVMGTVAEANLGMLNAMFGPKCYYFAMIFAAGLNFWLRTITALPVTTAPIVEGQPVK